MNEAATFSLSLLCINKTLKTRNRVDYYSLLKSADTKKSSRLKYRKLIRARYIKSNVAWMKRSVIREAMSIANSLCH
jgi:hypothetical protein